MTNSQDFEEGIEQKQGEKSASEQIRLPRETSEERQVSEFLRETDDEETVDDCDGESTTPIQSVLENGNFGTFNRFSSQHSHVYNVGRRKF